MKIVIIIVFFACIGGCLYQHLATAKDKQKYAPIGQLVDVGGYRLHMIDSDPQQLRHNLQPTIILESGMGCTTFDWLSVYPEIAKFARVIVYDRAGYGWSDASPLQRTSANIVQELHIMLDAADIAGPYILVGHSFGGMNVRLFAATYPEQVAGIILVDAVHEKIMDTIPQIFTHFASWVYRRLCAAYFGIPRMVSDYTAWYRGLSDSPKSADKAHKSSVKYFKALFDQLNLISISCAQLQAKNEPLLDIPVIVITAGKQVIPAQGPCGSYSSDEVMHINNNWFALQADLVHVSTASKQIIAQHSGHNIPYEQPELIIAAVREMFDNHTNV